MQIRQKFKTLSESLPMLRNRNCWKTCNDCGQPWAKTGTSTISMIIVKSKPPAATTRFLCDDCTDKRIAQDEEE